MIRIAVCDDDLNVIKEISQFLQEYEKNNSISFEILGFSDGDELLSSAQKFDLIFLDIEMKRINGFEAADNIREFDMNVPIVYITSHSGFFERAFKVHAFEYITKPIEQERLLRVMNDFFAAQHDSSEAEMQICTNNGFISVKLNSIYCFTAESKKNIYLHTKDGLFIIHENLRDIYENLDKTQFYMPKNNCIINLRNVQNFRNDYVIVMKNNMLLPLAQKKKDEFQKKLSSVFMGNLKGKKK